MSVAKQFGENLAACRKQARLTQEDLAIRADIHRTGLSKFEGGKTLPRLDTFLRLVGALEADPRELLEGIEWHPSYLQSGHFGPPKPLRP